MDNRIINKLRVPQSESLKCGELGASTLECLRAGCAQNKRLGFSTDAALPWVASALFQEEPDWAQGLAGAYKNKNWERQECYWKITWVIW